MNGIDTNCPKKLRLVGIGAACMLAVAGAGCATSGYGSGAAGYGSPASGYDARCYDCGVITRIEPVRTQRAPTATGAVIGGLVGAAAGRELADDESKGRRNTATVAGAAAGAVAGNAIQNAVQTQYNVHVRMDDGRTTVVTVPNVVGMSEGSRVRVRDGRIHAR
ncbi:glycine zipper 2TM domain-containing protein [Marilutibacter alkalisoli]|uniref:Glycine zipper 2TM domain-containing protein n=1 Tax=Marilutibacter alkalisoli TaxID=2591633 RepID=A0A514BS46_9GAMM|nr:glycine zipper 2TM domain-containing protein [Lysobacter alkalisoli]QDH70206.1 glycine zipper 2TM domain-containing protein [Lysobacter alkalisoli]